MKLNPVFPLLLACLIGCLPYPLMATEEFDFDIDAYKKKNYEFNGYIELLADRQVLNQDSAAYQLNAAALDGRDTLDHRAATAELSGRYTLSQWELFFTAHGTAEHDNLHSEDLTQFYQALVAYKPRPDATVELGKKALKWGKGYAWNPVAFVERLKDPNEPDLSREGYVMATADFIKSYGKNLQTLAFTPVYLPVNEDINKDFGQADHNNLALKLYMLYRNTDIDLLYLSEGSRSHRVGFDFSRNITTNFEIHGEWVYLSDVSKQVVDSLGNVSTEQASAQQWLVGLRYLTSNETTLIAEYYNNQAGYSEAQLTAFFGAVHTAADNGDNALLRQLATLSQQSYLTRNPGRRYSYLRLSNKEPFDWLYFTPAITWIRNVDDQSYSLSPELSYTGITDFELRIKANWQQGDTNTEFREKRGEKKLELRLRYFF